MYVSTLRLTCEIRDVHILTMTPLGMALFGMVWLLRVRSEMKRCAKCKRHDMAQAEERASTTTFFTINTPSIVPRPDTASPGHTLAPTTYCEVHGFNPPKEGEFRENNFINLEI